LPGQISNISPEFMTRLSERRQDPRCRSAEKLTTSTGFRQIPARTCMSHRTIPAKRIRVTARTLAVRATGSALLTATLLMAAAPAGAAAPQQVSGWGGSGLPSDVSMYVYVPSKVATKPPILTVIHYCGGTASTVFGQASGLVSAADQYGFIIVLPSSGRCWDVESNKAWTRSGGGDSDAIKQMVTYAITKYNANPDRVYSTGDSSGAMMTELLLALYPEIFKAGSAMAGMPAGCRGTNESGTGYSGACAGGMVTHTAQQWGDIARNMDPGYAGHRARVQLFHGSNDTTISPTMLPQAVLEWTNVLGLNANPDTSMTGVQLGSHQATRQQWKNACGYLVLDTFLSMGGDHGPSDALFLPQYVIPFLGLDKVGDVDPEIAQCGNGGPGGAGGARGTGGAGMGGQTSSGGHSGNGGAAGGGQPGTGGQVGSGGIVGSGGVDGGGGTVATGGSTQPSGSGGVSASGGQTGNPGSGGHASGGDSGHTGTGGTTSAGSGGAASGGTSGSGGAGTPPSDSGGGGCNCTLADPGASDVRWGVLVCLGMVLSLRARRRNGRFSRAASSRARSSPSSTASTSFTATGSLIATPAGRRRRERPTRRPRAAPPMARSKANSSLAVKPSGGAAAGTMRSIRRVRTMFSNDVEPRASEPRPNSAAHQTAATSGNSGFRISGTLPEGSVVIWPGESCISGRGGHARPPAAEY